MKNFIDEKLIFNLLEKHEHPNSQLIEEIITKSLDKKGLSLEETAILIQCTDKSLIEKIFDAASQIKKEIYGNRMVLFAPLYVTNVCQNDCLYCGFRASNKDLKRRTLSLDELREEVEIIEDFGHKRILLVYGESGNIDFLVDTVKTVYDTKKGKGEIRRLNVNAAPLTVDEFRQLKESGVGTYQCFQETYHQETYKKMHVSGKKTDYFWRLYALDRAQEAGLDDVATGVLFGLFDWRFEVLALLQHAQHLEETFGVGPHTISFPRIEPALNAPMSNHVPQPVSDNDFKKLVAITRLAVPYTGLILTTRETAELRAELIRLGISQISASSKTYPGGYKDSLLHKPDSEQFSLGDGRTLDEVILSITKKGYIPSFCTACYRLGRTGENFMNLAKPGDIHVFCQANALLTFAEYLEDYASEQTKEAGWALLNKEATKIDPSLKDQHQKYLEQIKNGKRDLFF